MYAILSLLSLPVSILLLISAAASPTLALDPHIDNRPAQLERSAEYRSLARRSLSIQKRLQEQTPCGVRKMPADAGQMFFLEYWLFDDNDSAPEGVARAQTEEEEDTHSLGSLENTEIYAKGANSPFSISPQPPLLLHANLTGDEHQVLRRYFNYDLSWLGRRDFMCPTNTTSCASINQPSSCCPYGQTCITIPNTGYGSVACCPDGSSCTDQVIPCQSDYPSCPPSQGGGCCIPGFECGGVGCVMISTVTVPIYETVTASISSGVNPPTSLVILTTLSTSSTTSTTSSITPKTTTSSAISNPPSLPSTSTISSSSSATVTPSPAVRGTSIPTTTITTTLTNTFCPTGYYQCSAYYNGGDCCQVGRDCALTSCPPHSTATALASDGITVLNEPTGGCASGWSLCDNDMCCMGGYTCSEGSTACFTGSQAPATGTAASVTGEATSRGANGRRGVLAAWGQWIVVVGLAFGCGLLW